MNYFITYQTIHRNHKNIGTLYLLLKKKSVLKRYNKQRYTIRFNERFNFWIIYWKLKKKPLLVKVNSSIKVTYFTLEKPNLENILLTKSLPKIRKIWNRLNITNTIKLILNDNIILKNLLTLSGVFLKKEIRLQKNNIYSQDFIRNILSRAVMFFLKNYHFDSLFLKKNVYIHEIIAGFVYYIFFNILKLGKENLALSEYKKKGTWCTFNKNSLINFSNIIETHNCQIQWQNFSVRNWWNGVNGIWLGNISSEFGKFWENEYSSKDYQMFFWLKSQDLEKKNPVFNWLSTNKITNTYLKKINNFVWEPYINRFFLDFRGRMYIKGYSNTHSELRFLIQPCLNKKLLNNRQPFSIRKYKNEWNKNNIFYYDVMSIINVFLVFENKPFLKTKKRRLQFYNMWRKYKILLKGTIQFKKELKSISLYKNRNKSKIITLSNKKWGYQLLAINWLKSHWKKIQLMYEKKKRYLNTKNVFFVEIDQLSSAWQILALITNDIKLARLTLLISSPKVKKKKKIDFYLTFLMKLKKKLTYIKISHMLQKSNKNNKKTKNNIYLKKKLLKIITLIRKILTRQKIKGLLIPILFGSSFFKQIKEQLLGDPTIKEQILDFSNNNVSYYSKLLKYLNIIFRKVFNDITKIEEWHQLLKKIYDILLPNSTGFLAQSQATSRPCYSLKGKKNNLITIELPDNGKVAFSYRATKSYKKMGWNIKYRYGYVLNYQAQKTAWLANVGHCLDAFFLRNIIKTIHTKFPHLPIIPLHDALKIPITHVVSIQKIINKVYNEFFRNNYEKNIMRMFYNQSNIKCFGLKQMQKIKILIKAFFKKQNRKTHFVREFGIRLDIYQ